MLGLKTPHGALENLIRRRSQMHGRMATKEQIAEPLYAILQDELHPRMKQFLDDMIDIEKRHTAEIDAILSAAINDLTRERAREIEQEGSSA